MPRFLPAPPHAPHLPCRAMSIQQLASTETRSEGDEAVHACLAAHLPDLVTELFEWARIPSVAGSDRDPAVLQSAHWLARTPQDDGFPPVEIWVARGPPAGLP